MYAANKNSYMTTENIRILLTLNIRPTVHTAQLLLTNAKM